MLIHSQKENYEIIIKKKELDEPSDKQSINLICVCIEFIFFSQKILLFIFSSCVKYE